MRCDRAHIQNYGDRFRFSTLQTRFATLAKLWDRSLRTKEEGKAVKTVRDGVNEQRSEPGTPTSARLRGVG